MTSKDNENNSSKAWLSNPTWRGTLASMALFGVLVGMLAIGSVQAQGLPDNDNPEVQRVEPFQVFDNLYYIGARWVASWLLVTDQGLIVFDALYGDLTDLVIENIRVGIDQ
ncbi:MAG: hypothetical protein ACE37D_11525 [Pseudomonadales bacterium]